MLFGCAVWLLADIPFFHVCLALFCDDAARSINTGIVVDLPADHPSGISTGFSGRGAAAADRRLGDPIHAVPFDD